MSRRELAITVGVCHYWDFLICLESLLPLLTYTEDVSNETVKSVPSETAKIEVDDGKMTSCLSRGQKSIIITGGAAFTVYRTYGIRKSQHQL